MRDFTTPRTFVLSAYTEGKSVQENHARHCELANDLELEGVPFAECEGEYNGVGECGYVVTGALHERTVRELSLHWNQDTYLCVAENDRAAYLVAPLSGFHTHIGTLVSHGDTPPDTGAWTLLQGTYFHTVVKGALIDLKGGI